MRINQSVPEFSAHAFHNGEFVQINNQTIAGKWGGFSSTPPTSPLCAPPNWRIWRTITNSFNNWALKFTLCPPTPILPTKHGTTLLTRSKKFNSQ